MRTEWHSVDNSNEFTNEGKSSLAFYFIPWRRNDVIRIPKYFSPAPALIPTLFLPSNPSECWVTSFKEGSTVELLWKWNCRPTIWSCVLRCKQPESYALHHFLSDLFFIKYLQDHAEESPLYGSQKKFSIFPALRLVVLIFVTFSGKQLMARLTHFV